MQAIDRPFTRIINGATQFVIPVFQRDYSWVEAQCEQLWNDVLHVARDSSERGHFLGSVVYISTGDSSAGFTRWLLIDGQQRMTTLTLMLIALRDHIRDAGWEGGEDDPTVKRIEAYFLKNVEEKEDREYKLVLRRHDQETLQALLNGRELPAGTSESIKDYGDSALFLVAFCLDPRFRGRRVGHVRWRISGMTIRSRRNMRHANEIRGTCILSALSP